MTTDGTSHEQKCLEALEKLLPGAELFDPSRRFKTNAGWLRAWPRILRTLDAMVVFPADDGTIGVGCLREISDAIRCHVPVIAFDLRSGIVELEGLDFFLAGTRCARRATVMRLGEPVNLS